MNTVLLTGKLGRDAEVSYTPSGTAICSLSMVTSDSKKQQDGSWKDENVEWHTIKVFGSLAEKCGQLRKGSEVFVNGMIHYESWEKDGVKHYKTTVKSFHVRPIAKWESQPQQHYEPQPAPVVDEGDISSDLPF